MRTTLLPLVVAVMTLLCATARAPTEKYPNNTCDILIFMIAIHVGLNLAGNSSGCVLSIYYGCQENCSYGLNT